MGVIDPSLKLRIMEALQPYWLQTRVLPWGDIIEAVVVFTVFFGVVGGFAYSTGAFTQQVKSKNEELKKMGYSLSSQGVSIKTDKRQLKDEDLADHMQRSMSKTAASGALKFRPGAGAGDPPPVSDSMSRSGSQTLPTTPAKSTPKK